MTQPTQSTIPTGARVVNGGISGTAAQILGNMATAWIMSQGVDPANATVMGTMAGSAASGGLAVLGSWSRGVLDQMPQGVGWSFARLPFMLMGILG